MFKIVSYILLIIIPICSTWAQVDKCPVNEIVINDSVYNVFDSSVFEAVIMNYYMAFDTYLYSYLEINDSVSYFLNFIGTLKDLDKDFVRYISKNENCTQIFQNDSISTMSIGDEKISITISNPIVNCNPSVEGYHNRSLVKIFDSKGQLSNKDKLYKTFNKQRRSFYRHYRGQEGQFKHYFSKETNSERLVVVLYRFDQNLGLSLATICKSSHTLKQNEYINSLTEFADSFCHKHRLSKIIFSGLLPNE